MGWGGVGVLAGRRKIEVWRRGGVCVRRLSMKWHYDDSDAGDVDQPYGRGSGRRESRSETDRASRKARAKKRSSSLSVVVVLVARCFGSLLLVLLLVVVHRRKKSVVI